jgi:hypothetical protein
MYLHYILGVRYITYYGNKINNIYIYVNNIRNVAYGRNNINILSILEYQINYLIKNIMMIDYIKYLNNYTNTDLAL